MSKILKKPHRIKLSVHKKPQKYPITTTALSASMDDQQINVEKPKNQGQKNDPIVNGTFLKMESARRRFIPSCSVDKIDAFFYNLDYSASKSQMVIKTNSSSPCEHQLSKIIESHLILRKNKSKMLVD